VDVLVNNAGMQAMADPGYGIDQQLRLIQVNLVSLATLTMLFIQEMPRRGGGRILNVGSTGSFATAPLQRSYCASKAFVLSFSDRSPALEGTGISGHLFLVSDRRKTDFANAPASRDVPSPFCGNERRACARAGTGR